MDPKTGLTWRWPGPADTPGEHVIAAALQLAVEDPFVSRAMRFIREHDCRGITVRDELIEAGCSRSVLERRFREDRGRSPQTDMRIVQLRRVRQLLVETDWTLPCIAKAMGIEHPEYRSVVVKRETVQTPGQFRQAAQAEQRGRLNGDFSWRIRQLNVEVWLRRRERISREPDK